MKLLANYLAVAIRNANKQKLTFSVSVIGLGLAIAAALVIAGYTGFERSYDRFHQNADHIYRVTTEWNITETPDDRRATTVQWSGPGVQSAFPEVQAYTRVMPLSRMTGDNAVLYNNKAIEGGQIMLADPGFLQVFSFPLIMGNPATALSEPRSVIVSESIARLHFPGENPVGKALFIDTHGNLNGNDFKITGVIGDAPINSHFRYDFLVSFTSMWEGLSSGSTYWHWDNTYCYLLLHPDADAHALGEKISHQRVKEFASEFNGWLDQIDFKLQPLTDIHLTSSLKGEIGINGNGEYVSYLLILTVCILLSACINFINLTVARSIARQTEFGIRRVSGSSANQLMVQLVTETVVTTALAILIGVFVARMSVPFLESYFAVAWPGSFLQYITVQHYLVMLAAFVLMMLVSLAYPAFVIRTIQPALVLKGNRTFDARGWSLKKYLVIVQFGFALTFTVASFVLTRQMQFIRFHHPGFDREQVVVVKGYGFQKYGAYEKFQTALLAGSGVISTGLSSAAPGDEVLDLTLRPRVSVGDAMTLHEVKLLTADEGFFRTLGIPFLAGRTFDRWRSDEKNTVIVNEAAARLLGYDNSQDIVLQPLNGIQDGPATIIGVVKNYHQRSFRNNYEPVIFIPSWAHAFGWDARNFFIKLDGAGTGGYDDQLKNIERAWKSAVPELPFNYFFLDIHFAREYKADISFGALFTTFSGFAIFITLLGLLGMVAHVAINRTREIGIRKVLGASVENILAMLSWDFLKLVAIAALIFIPIVVVGVETWLEGFAFRVTLEPWHLAVPVVMVVFLILTIVLLRSLHTASNNPADSLRHE